MRQAHYISMLIALFPLTNTGNSQWALKQVVSDPLTAFWLRLRLTCVITQSKRNGNKQINCTSESGSTCDTNIEQQHTHSA